MVQQNYAGGISSGISKFGSNCALVITLTVLFFSSLSKTSLFNKYQNKSPENKTIIKLKVIDLFPYLKKNQYES